MTGFRMLHQRLSTNRRRTNRWNYEGLQVTGKYLDEFLVSGKVTSSRVKYGGTVTHVVVLDKSIDVYGSVRDIVILNMSDITQVTE